MVKAVFIQNRHSVYDDLPGHAYHFPKLYLSRVEQTVGDWVILYESSKSGGLGCYFAVQRVDKIVQDPTKDDHYYAFFKKGNSSRLDFVQPVQIKSKTGAYFEGENVGWTNAVRLISENVFNQILDAGMMSIDDGFAIARSNEPAAGFAEERTPFLHGPRETILTSRKYREPKFREGVVRAYQGRCALSGLELRNGGGRAEVQAAHIQSVEADGPDAIQNGLALSGTLHWMFDRGLVGIDEDNRTILIAKDTAATDQIEKLIVVDRQIIAPSSPHFQPHPEFITWHRNHVFHG